MMAVSCEGDAVEVDLDNVPIDALNVSSRMALSWFLNPEQPIRSSSGVPRDYRGLAELMDFGFNDIRNFQRSEDPTSKTLDAWEKKHSSSIGYLIKFLEKMERFDVIEEVLNQFKNDAISYLKRMKRNHENPIQVPEVTSCRPMMAQVENPNALTVSDAISGECTFYDAYVCYSEEDSPFVSELAKYLESPQIGLKLFIKGRDLLSGNFEPNSCVELIHDRCSRMLIILSPEFLRSLECEFQTSFAAGLAIEQRRRKLIPIVIKPCEIPLILKYISKIDFTKPVFHTWLWEKLVQSIRGVSNSIFVSPQALPTIPLNPQLELPLPAPSDPIVVFPDTVQYPLQPPSVQILALPSPAAEATKSAQVRKLTNPTASTSRNQPSKNRWFSNIKGNIKGRINSLNSSSSGSGQACSSSTATSGYQSQGTLPAESSDESE